jgi:Cu/Ag efflux pump CusA
MLSTGIKTPVGIKIGGPDLEVLERLAEEVEAVVKPLPGTLSAFAERVMGGSYLDFDIDREAAARFGLTVGDVQDVIQSAVGGMNVSWTVEGLERYPINVRYPRELRDNPNALAEILVATPTGAQVPLGQLATLEIRQGPPAIKSENARPNAWVYVDLRGIDVGSWVERARQEVSRRVELPPGYTIFWSGQYEYMERARQRLLVIVPITLFSIFFILYFHLKSIVKTAIVLSAIPFSLVGGGDAAVFGSRLRGLEEAGSDGVLQRSARSRRPRRGQEDPAQDDDRDGHLLLPGTHSVGDRGRFGCHAPHRRPHGRWHLYLLCGRAVGLPGDLLHLAWDRPGAHTPFSIGRRNKRSNE